MTCRILKILLIKTAWDFGGHVISRNNHVTNKVTIWSCDIFRSHMAAWWCTCKANFSQTSKKFALHAVMCGISYTISLTVTWPSLEDLQTFNSMMSNIYAQARCICKDNNLYAMEHYISTCLLWHKCSADARSLGSRDSAVIHTRVTYIGIGIQRSQLLNLL